VEVGLKVGVEVGLKVGVEVGLKVGVEVGLKVGVEVGLKVGVKVGLEVVGGEVGEYVLSLQSPTAVHASVQSPLTPSAGAYGCWLHQPE
jgi:hypothetical protein